MKQSLLLTFLMFFVTLGFGQSKSLNSSRNIYKYYIDSTAYNQIDILYSNSSDSAFVLWIDRSRIDSLTLDKKIKKYFYLRRGDFTLSDLLYENLINEIPIELFMTFVKIIRPNEQFQITIIKKGENQINVDYLNNLISHIAVVKQCAKLVPDLVSLEKFNYKARSITIFSEAMNE